MKKILDKETGVYIFIDDQGNVRQVTKEKKTLDKFYHDKPTAVDNIIGDVWVIGVSDDIAMGVGDETASYAKYI